MHSISGRSGGGGSSMMMVNFVLSPNIAAVYHKITVTDNRSHRNFETALCLHAAHKHLQKERERERCTQIQEHRQTNNMPTTCAGGKTCSFVTHYYKSIECKYLGRYCMVEKREKKRCIRTGTFDFWRGSFYWLLFSWTTCSWLPVYVCATRMR